MDTAAAMMAKRSTQSDEALPIEGAVSRNLLKDKSWRTVEQPSIPVSSRASGLIVIRSNLCGMISTLSFVFPAIIIKLLVVDIKV